MCVRDVESLLYFSFIKNIFRGLFFGVCCQTNVRSAVWIQSDAVANNYYLSSESCLKHQLFLFPASSSLFLVVCHYWIFFSLLETGGLGYIRQWAEWRRAREEEKNFIGTAGRALMFTHCSLIICTLLQTCIPPSSSSDCTAYHRGYAEITPFTGIYGNALHWVNTLIS